MMRLMLTAACVLLGSFAVHAQDVPGIEICTVEKTMERRTSCLQSNVDFLMKTISKLGQDHRLKLDAAQRQIETLNANVAALQKTVDDVKAAQAAKPAAKEAPASKDNAK